MSFDGTKGKDLLSIISISLVDEEEMEMIEISSSSDDEDDDDDDEHTCSSNFIFFAEM